MGDELKIQWSLDLSPASSNNTQTRTVGRNSERIRHRYPSMDMAPPSTDPRASKLPRSNPHKASKRMPYNVRLPALEEVDEFDNEAKDEDHKSSEVAEEQVRGGAVTNAYAKGDAEGQTPVSPVYRKLSHDHSYPPTHMNPSAPPE